MIKPIQRTMGQSQPKQLITGMRDNNRALGKLWGCMSREEAPGSTQLRV